MKLASSEAKNATALAISSGLATRPRGGLKSQVQHLHGHDGKRSHEDFQHVRFGNCCHTDPHRGGSPSKIGITGHTAEAEPAGLRALARATIELGAQN